MSLRFVIWLALLVASLAPAASRAAAPPANPPGRYAPRDLCNRLPGAIAFRAALAAATTRRDGEALARLAAPGVELDFGGGAGRNMLRQRMRGSEGEGRWRALAQLLPLGCAVSRGELTMPWFFAQDLGDLDPFEVLLATGTRVPVYPRASITSRPVGQLSWQLVTPVAGVDPAQAFQKVKAFQQVKLVGGALTGYVASGQLRSPVDYRLTAARSHGAWQITAFIAGD